MVLISFVCPLCHTYFTKHIEHDFDAAALFEHCPHCHVPIKITTEQLLEVSTASIFTAHTGMSIARNAELGS